MTVRIRTHFIINEQIIIIFHGNKCSLRYTKWGAIFSVVFVWKSEYFCILCLFVCSVCLLSFEWHFLFAFFWCWIPKLANTIFYGNIKKKRENFGEFDVVFVFFSFSKLPKSINIIIHKTKPSSLHSLASRRLWKEVISIKVIQPWNLFSTARALITNQMS